MGSNFFRDMKIHNMIYQGNVFGPTLWNIFFADAAMAVKVHGFPEIFFADDLNCYKAFGLFIGTLQLHAQMRQC